MTMEGDPRYVCSEGERVMTTPGGSDDLVRCGTPADKHNSISKADRQKPEIRSGRWLMGRTGDIDNWRNSPCQIIEFPGMSEKKMNTTPKILRSYSVRYLKAVDKPPLPLEEIFGNEMALRHEYCVRTIRMQRPCLP